MSTNRVSFFHVYKAPFRADKYSCYIWDADNRMVADMKGEGDTFRTRGWGYLQYLPNAHALHDTLDEVFQKAVADCRTDHHKCVEALNALWANQ